ncbi:hypothetical protein [Microvirga sp. 2MCAF38]|uniref:hypothetical protein n=1 Tax=Microvirga sp. 2MCAF38 TaxID=3232989 RepID=UPI003F9B52A3
MAAATGADPTGLSGMAAGYAYQAEVNANLKAWQAQNPAPNPDAELAKVEAIRQKAIADGVLNPDGTSKR